MAQVPEREGRKQWAAWAAREVGPDPVRQEAAVSAALVALAAGRTAEDAANAARSAAGLAPRPVAVTAGPSAIAAPVYTGPLRCRFCGSTPAVALTLHQHSGFVLLFTHRQLPGPFCRSCGLSAMRRMSNSTALRGWFGLLSFFITPVTLIINGVAWTRIRALGEPVPTEGSVAPADPGSPMVRRPGIYVYGIAMFVLAALFTSSYVGPAGCYSDRNAVQTAVIKAHDTALGKANSALKAIDACTTVDCAHSAAPDVATAFDDFTATMRAQCFASNESAHANDLIKASLAVSAAARVAASADASGMDAALNDLDAKGQAFLKANDALNADLNITISST